jgi:DNA-binding FrmR family transcriptional regulator
VADRAIAPRPDPPMRALHPAVTACSAACAILSYPREGDIDPFMSEPHRHASHPGLVKRLKRADGHLRHVIGMIEAGAPCADIAVQLQAVEKAITAAKRTLIHDHIDHCLTGGAADLEEMKSLAKLL